jgi:hypothetical protein
MRAINYHLTHFNSEYEALVHEADDLAKQLQRRVNEAVKTMSSPRRQLRALAEQARRLFERTQLMLHSTIRRFKAALPHPVALVLLRFRSLFRLQKSEKS